MEATSSRTRALAAEIQRAIEVLPASHQIGPQDRELVDNPSDGYIRLQDWAFIQGFALVKASTRAERWVLHCIHQKRSQAGLDFYSCNGYNNDLQTFIFSC